jgi:choline dehydrogenase-like flavoprotein
MAQFAPTTEVDFVIIGSGAAGGIMAKQLSTAGFKVVVLEQGGWGKYGKEHEYTKDEWLNDMDPDAQWLGLFLGDKPVFKDKPPRADRRKIPGPKAAPPDATDEAVVDQK